MKFFHIRKQFLWLIRLLPITHWGFKRNRFAGDLDDILNFLFIKVKLFGKLSIAWFTAELLNIRSGDSNDTYLKDFIEDENDYTPVDAVVNDDLKEKVREVLKTLTPREERVLKMRFGIDVASEHTLEEVGKDFSVTRERIRQIEVKALRKLRHPSRSKKLQSFFDKEFDIAASETIE